MRFKKTYLPDSKGIVKTGDNTYRLTDEQHLKINMPMYTIMIVGALIISTITHNAFVEKTLGNVIQEVEAHNEVIPGGWKNHIVGAGKKVSEEYIDTVQEASKQAPIEVIIEKPIQHKVEEKEVVIESKFDIDRLAYAVAMQETKNCTLGYGKTHNNCFGIKHGNTVPCPGVPKMAMCKFDTPEESYEAFKIIWTKWYGEMPTMRLANKWAGGDRVDYWYNNVLYFYNKGI